MVCSDTKSQQDNLLPYVKYVIHICVYFKSFTSHKHATKSSAQSFPLRKVNFAADVEFYREYIIITRVFTIFQSS